MDLLSPGHGRRKQETERRTKNEIFTLPSTPLRQTTGQNLAKRREIHASEGMHKPRMSSVLGVGRSEMASYGVSDQFERSSYGYVRLMRLCVTMFSRGSPKFWSLITGIPTIAHPRASTPGREGSKCKTERTLQLCVHLCDTSQDSCQDFLRVTLNARQCMDPIILHMLSRIQMTFCVLQRTSRGSKIQPKKNRTKSHTKKQ